MLNPILRLFLFFLLLSFFGQKDYVIAQDQVLDSLKSALTNHPEMDTTRVKLLINISNTIVWNDALAALTYAEKALQLSRDLNWQKGVVGAIRQQGVAYYHQSDLLRALDSFQEALRKSDQLTDSAMKPSLYNNIASIYADLDQHEKAIAYYEEFLQSARSMKRKGNEVIALTNIGVSFNDMDQSEKAINYLHKALEIAKNEGFRHFQSAILNNLAIAYDTKGDYDNATDYFDQAIELASGIGNKNTMSSALNSISQIQVKQGNYKAAEQSGLEALQYAREVNSLERQRDIWKNLNNIYEKKEDVANALSAYKNYILFKDSVLGEANKTELTRKEMRFEMEKKEAIAATELSQAKLIRNLVIVGGIMLLLFSFLAYWFYNKKRIAIDQQQKADFKTKVAETELKALLSQMNPHFIFNALNSISDFIAKNDAETANLYLIKFANLIRKILESSEDKTISLSDDLKLIENYIEIELLRLKGKFNYEIKVDPEIDPENTLIPTLIIQPFVENSIWHGLAGKNGDGKLLLEIKQSGDELIYCVDDNGIGRLKSSKIKVEHQPMGTKISEHRLDIINKLKGGDSKIAFIDKPEGTRVEVKLPLELAF